MDSDGISSLLRTGSVRVTMNDGSQFELPPLGEKCLVGPISVRSLFKDEASGKPRINILSLLSMVRAEQIEPIA
ncbi:MAG: hypothetical protein AAF745_02990 [Planctomycetota bacterium]